MVKYYICVLKGGSTYVLGWDMVDCGMLFNMWIFQGKLGYL